MLSDTRRTSMLAAICLFELYSLSSGRVLVDTTVNRMCRVLVYSDCGIKAMM